MYFGNASLKVSGPDPKRGRSAIIGSVAFHISTRGILLPSSLKVDAALLATSYVVFLLGNKVNAYPISSIAAKASITIFLCQSRRRLRSITIAQANPVPSHAPLAKVKNRTAPIRTSEITSIARTGLEYSVCSCLRKQAVASGKTMPKNMPK